MQSPLVALMAVYDGKGNKVHCCFFELNPHILEGLATKEPSSEQVEKVKNLVLKIKQNVDA